MLSLILLILSTIYIYCIKWAWHTTVLMLLHERAQVTIPSS